MKTTRFFSFILISFFLLFFILSNVKDVSAQERSGIGISPSCFPSEDSECKLYYEFTQHLYNMNDVFATEFRVYNFDNKTREFYVEIKPVSCEFSKEGLERINDLTSPTHFILNRHDTGDCNTSHGCQIIKVIIPSTSIKEGECTLNLLVTSPDEIDNTMLKVNQIIGAKISIHKKDCWIYKFSGIIFILLILITIGLIVFIKRKRKIRKNAKTQNKHQI